MGDGPGGPGEPRVGPARREWAPACGVRPGTFLGPGRRVGQGNEVDPDPGARRTGTDLDGRRRVVPLDRCAYIHRSDFDARQSQPVLAGRGPGDDGRGVEYVGAVGSPLDTKRGGRGDGRIPGVRDDDG